MEPYRLKFVLILMVTFNGLFLGILIVAGQFVKEFRSLKPWLFLLLFVIFSLFQIHYIFFEAETLDRYKVVNLFPIAAYYLLGPLIYMITKTSLIEKFQPSNKELAHFFTPVIITLMAAVMIYTSDYAYAPRLHGYYYNENLSILGGIGVLVFSVYIGLSVRELIRSLVFSKAVIKHNAFALAALSIVLITAFALFFDILAIAFNARLFMELSLLSLNLVIISLFFILFAYPDYEKTIQAAARKERKRRSYLAGVDIDSLKERIHHLIMQEEILSNENLSLETMAQKAGVTKHQLSEFLNQYMGENFSTFTKKNRINRAKQLLVQHPDRKILAIAFDVGFKSKSTFNTAFQHFENETPAQYRKKNQK